MKKFIKKIFSAILLMTFASVLFSCGNDNDVITKNNSVRNNISPDVNTVYETVADIMDMDANIGNRKMVVTYFSINGTTKQVAEKIATTINADTMEIIPEVEYTEDDLDRNDSSSRSAKEVRFIPWEVENMIYEADYETSPRGVVPSKEEKVVEGEITELPDIKNINVNNYDIIFVGYPIWYKDAPKVIYKFIEPLRNKIIIPFCTSDGDSIDISEEGLFNYADESNLIMSGQRFDINVSEDDIKSWITRLSADMH